MKLYKPDRVGKAQGGKTQREAKMQKSDSSTCLVREEESDRVEIYDDPNRALDTRSKDS